MLALTLIGPPIAAQSLRPTILVLGDSLSAAYGIDPDRGWVRLLESRLAEHGLDYRVINASVSGDTTAGGLARLPRALELYEPEVVIIELGANDGLRGLPPAEMQSNLTRMVELSRAQGAKVLLLGVRLPANYGPAFNQRFAAVYPAVAAQAGASLIRRFLAGVAEDRALMQPDGVHPRAGAQPIILDNVWPALECLLRSSGTQ